MQESKMADAWLASAAAGTNENSSLHWLLLQSGPMLGQGAATHLH